MRQLAINDMVESCAHRYLVLLNKNKIREKSLLALSALETKFSGVNTVDLYQYKSNVVITSINGREFELYIKTLKDRYDSLRIMHPHNFQKEIRRFERIISRDYVSLKMSLDGGAKIDSLSNQIVEALQYKEMRNKVYPKVARTLGLKTCVYCNANYTITDKCGKGYYDLDHWKPKSKYPYLSTSFYNLQPSCSYCNRNKSDNEGPFFSLWDDNNRNHRNVVGVNLTRKSIVDYILTHNSSKLSMRLFPYEPRYQEICNNMKNTLHIEDRYLEHIDVAEEIIWKSLIYKDSYLSTLKKSLAKSLLSDEEIGRFILGTYLNSENIHKRPLSSMTLNISRQVGLTLK